MRISVPCLLLGSLGSLEAQERVEIDHDAGRVILDSPEWAFTDLIAVDHRERLLYIGDLAEPFAILAFSLDDGSLQGKYGGIQGDGPGELRDLVAVAAMHDGVVMADHARMNRWGVKGNLVWTWRPPVSVVSDVCSFRDDPAVPAFEGAVLRASDGDPLMLGKSTPVEDAISTGDGAYERAREFAMELSFSNIACVGDVAYVQMGNRLMAHTADGETHDVEIPPPLAEDAARGRRPPGEGRYRAWYAGMSTDGGPRLVLRQFPRSGREFSGAVIDPVTECYTLVSDRDRGMLARKFMGMYRDSALVYYRHWGPREVDGRTVNIIEPEAYRVALRPLRRLDGEPCPR